MSRNYDNWERLVAAVLKKELIWQLCHQDSISTICSDYSSSRLDFTLPVFRGSIDSFEIVGQLRDQEYSRTNLVRLVQDVQVSDQQYLPKGSKVIVKSLYLSKITQDEFEGHMIVLGNCRHENVRTPWACHFSETTKLIFYYYHTDGSVFDMLHGSGNRSSRPGWESRVRFAVGAARGIAHVHAQRGGNLAHGNIKSSSIFLNLKGYGSVSDFDLGGGDQPSQESDVYNFGLLLVELVTRKLPTEASTNLDHIRSLKPEEWHLDFFGIQEGLGILVDEIDTLRELRKETIVHVDPELRDSLAVAQEMRRMLEVAKRCLCLLADMSQVVLELESIQWPSRSQVVLELESIERPPISEVVLGLQSIERPPMSQVVSEHRQVTGRVKKAAWHNRFLRFRR